jgi:hypothetical protein
MADKNTATPTPTPNTGTYVIDRPTYNSPGCLPLMPGDTRVFEHRLVAHLVRAGFMHAQGTDPNPLSVAVNSPTVMQSASEVPAPLMPAAPEAQDKSGQPTAAPAATQQG